MNIRKLAHGLYAGTAYVVGMGALLYLMAFLIGAPVPKTIDAGPTVPLPESPLMNLALLAAFLVPHSVMARPRFKAWWTTIIPAASERSTYILYSGLTTLSLIWAWQPMPTPIWQVEGAARFVLYGTYALGWATIVLATFHIDHLSFFGLRQAWDAILSRPSRPVPFTARWLYGLVRHPISLGWLLVFWSSPVMSAGHLVFALGMSLYIVVVTPLEERDLVTEHGDEYRRYQARVPAFVPIPRRDDEHTEPSRRFS